MLFLSKRDAGPRSSGSEACLSILGLFVAIGIIGGAAALIYGLVKGNLSATIGGGAIVGLSVFCIVVLTIIYICCLKKSNVNSLTNDQQVSSHPPKHRQNRPVKRGHASSHDITHISTIHQYDHPSHQQQPNPYSMQILPPTNHTNGLSDSTNYNYGKRISQSPSHTNFPLHLSQNYNSVQNPDHRFISQL